jgi:hypothetical protein
VGPTRQPGEQRATSARVPSAAPSRGGLASLAGALGNAAFAQIARAPRVLTGPEQEGESLEAFKARKTRQLKAEFAPVVAYYRDVAKAKLDAAKADFSAMTLSEQSTKVAADNTPVSKEELAEALKSAWQKVFRQPCPPSAMALVIGKFQTEGGTRKAVWNYNIGNVQVPADPYKSQPGKPVYSPGVQIDGKKAGEHDYHELNSPENLPDGTRRNRRSRFIAYQSLEQGVIGLLYAMIGDSESHPKRAMFGVLVADSPKGDRVEDYVKVGFATGYFTAMPYDVVFGGRKVEAGYHGGMAGTVPKGGELDTLMLPEGGSSEGPRAPGPAGPEP